MGCQSLHPYYPLECDISPLGDFFKFFSHMFTWTVGWTNTRYWWSKVKGQVENELASIPFPVNTIREEHVEGISGLWHKRPPRPQDDMVRVWRSKVKVTFDKIHLIPLIKFLQGLHYIYYMHLDRHGCKLHLDWSVKESNSEAVVLVYLMLLELWRKCLLFLKEPRWYSAAPMIRCFCCAEEEPC